MRLNCPPVRGHPRCKQLDLPGSQGEQRHGVDPAREADAEAEREAVEGQARGRDVALEGERGGGEATRGEGVGAEVDRGGGGGRVRGEEDEVGGGEQVREAGRGG